MKAIDAYNILKVHYSFAKISLSYSNPLELLIAVMLSAQCTDKRVNIVTDELFKRYKTAKDYALCDIDELRSIIRSTGFFNNKAKNIKEACRLIVMDFSGNVPDEMDLLLRLPGVARKTANIVLSNAYGKNEGIAVDTHVKRITYRIGATKNANPDKIERDLMKELPKDIWNKYTYVVIEHGRAVCKAPTPICSKCPLKGCNRIGVKKWT